MRQEKLFKLLIILFFVIMVVLAGFVYGNVARNKQTSQNNKPSEQKQPTPAPAPAQQNNQANLPANAKNEPNKPGQDIKTPASSTPAPAPAPTAAKPANGTIPQTGVEIHYEAIPATILATLGYIYIKQRRANSLRG